MNEFYFGGDAPGQTDTSDPSPFRVSQGLWSIRGLTTPDYNAGTVVQTPSADVAAPSPPADKPYCHQQPRNVSPGIRPYVQDTWTVSDKLTASLGIRFEKEDGSPPVNNASAPDHSPPHQRPDFHGSFLDPRIYRQGSKEEW